MAHTVVAGDPWYDDLEVERRIIEEAGGELVETGAETVEELLAATDEADVLVFPPHPVTREVFEHFDGLEAICVSSVGVDYIDVAAAIDHGVIVSNAPAVNAEEVSTHAVALLLAAIRKIPVYDRGVREGEWGYEMGAPIHRLTDSTLGIVGFGDIGRRVARKLSGFEFEVLAYDPYHSADEIAAAGAQKATFDEVVERSDVVSNHTPLTDETRGLFDADAFAAMPDHAIFANTSRGPVHDEDALYDALVGGEIAGAALDVFEEEPIGDSPLLDLDNVVLSPHIAGYSEESFAEGRERLANNVVAILRGEAPDNVVNEEDWI